VNTSGTRNSEAMRISKLSIPLCVAWLTFCDGCGSGDGLVPVEGVVTLDGQPMPGIQVMFDQPELSANENKGYTGRTDEEGRFVLAPALAEGSGVPPGKYRVSLSTAYDPSAPAPPSPRQNLLFDPESAPPPPERVPSAYRGGKLSFTVPEGGTDQANFELKSK
jgi:hypothetical protein